MRTVKSLSMFTLVSGATLFLGINLLAAEKCCECGEECKLKKVYRPVVTFKECTFQCWDYKTVCKDVFVPTTTCCTSCGSCDGACGCPGKPKKMRVPVAVVSKSRECTRKVPVVTWVVQCRCEKCCKKPKRHHDRHFEIAEPRRNGLATADARYLKTRSSAAR